MKRFKPGLAAAVFGLMFLGALMPLGVMIQGCGETKPDLPVVLQIEGNDIYIDELEQLGRVALSKSNLSFDTAEGQAQYKKIAPNLYESLIDIYVIKHAAEREGVKPTEEELNAEIEKFKKTMQDTGQLDQFMASLGVDEDRLRESIEDMLAMNLFQAKKLEEGEREPTEEEIKEFYYQNNHEFRFPTKLRASHIFIESPETEDEATRERARQRAGQILKMLGDTPSQTFVGFAQRYSEDPGSGPKGGDLGFFRRDEPRVPESFKDVAFGLDVGKISGVVETDIGYHIIWVTDHEQSLEEAKPELEIVLRQKSMADSFAKWRQDARKDMNIIRLFDPESYRVLTMDEAAARAKEK